MIIYNITCKVDWAVHDNWLQWVRQQFFPDMLDSGLFYHAHLLKLLDTDDTDGVTYALQFHTDSLEKYRRYTTDPALLPLRRQQSRWNDAVVGFGSVMEGLD